MAKSASTRQTSNKSGVASTSKKLDNSRHGFDSHPATRKVDGAFGKERGRTAAKGKPGTAVTGEGKASALRRVK
jgi:hypothetical protein